MFRKDLLEQVTLKLEWELQEAPAMLSPRGKAFKAKGIAWAKPGQACSDKSTQLVTLLSCLPVTSDSAMLSTLLQNVLEHSLWARGYTGLTSTLLMTRGTQAFGRPTLPE